MSERTVRVLLSGLGVLVIGYGCLRLVQLHSSILLGLAEWLLGAALLHDVIIAPIVIGIGWLINRYVPAAIRPYAQGGLVTAALVSSVALILILRQHKYSAASLALLRQNYLLNTGVLFAAIAGATVVCYVIASVSRRTSLTKNRPPDDH